MSALLFGLVAAPLVAQAPVGPDPAITAADLERHVRFLASDALLGRAMGSPESARAARYAAAELAWTGVAPATPDGAYLQTIPLVERTYDASPELVVASGGEEHVLLYGRDLDWRAFAQPDDTGELRVVVVEEASAVPREPAPDVALVLCTTPRRAGRWLADAGHDGAPGFGLVLVPRDEEVGEPDAPRSLGPRPEDGGRTGATVVSLRGPWSERFRASEVETVRLRTNARRAVVEDFNTVGVIRGVGTPARPELADEAIVLTAHRDHIGVQPAAPSIAADGPVVDRIANGADDDASGCAVVLEIAAALAAGPPPARTVVVALVTGEERGMVGSRWYVENPVVPLEDTVCNLNFEMLGRPDELVGGPGNVWMTGFERSTLGEELVAAGASIVADPRPEQSFFFRSDNVSFVDRGIVAHTLSTFGLHTDYHQVTDEPDTLDYVHMEAAARRGLAAVRALADGTVTPRWHEGEPRR